MWKHSPFCLLYYCLQIFQKNLNIWTLGWKVWMSGSYRGADCVQRCADGWGNQFHQNYELWILNYGYDADEPHNLKCLSWPLPGEGTLKPHNLTIVLLSAWDSDVIFMRYWCNLHDITIVFGAYTAAFWCLLFCQEHNNIFDWSKKGLLFWGFCELMDFIFHKEIKEIGCSWTHLNTIWTS